MIFFNWKRILQKAGRSSRRILLAIKSMISTSMPKNRYDPLYDFYYTDFKGESFLLNPYSLVAGAGGYTPKEIAQYIGLASFRNYGYYKVTKDASLDLFHSPVSEDNINKNRLLRIKDGRVYFYFEEDTSRRNKLWH